MALKLYSFNMFHYIFCIFNILYSLFSSHFILKLSIFRPPLGTPLCDTRVSITLNAALICDLSTSHSDNECHSKKIFLTNVVDYHQVFLNISHYGTDDVYEMTFWCSNVDFNFSNKMIIQIFNFNAWMRLKKQCHTDNKIIIIIFIRQLLKIE